jgi:RNA polymerase sigma factor (sigma-70 family)
LGDDVAQQVFIKLERKAKQLCEHPSLGAWLHRTAVLEASNLARKEERHAEKKSRLKEVVDVEKSLQKSVVLDEGLANLRAGERQVLVLHYYEGLTFSEVGKRLGVSEAAAQKRAHRALERLAGEVRKRGFADMDAKPCLTLLLAAKPMRESVPQGVVTKVLGAKASTAASSAWLVGLGLALVGVAGGYVALESQQQPEALPSSESIAQQDGSNVQVAATRSDRKLFEPKAADEALSPEVRRFIELAQEDGRKAFEFAKGQPGDLERFLENAVEALADRDLPVADRFLAYVEASEPRRKTIEGIIASRLRRSFEEAVSWVDSLPTARDRSYVLHGAGYESYLDYDYSGALRFARSPEVRRFLIEQACEKAENEDESQIERMAGYLVGAERDLALTHAASLLLQRGDERAFELLNQVEGPVDYLPGTDGIVKRDPEPLLDWLMEHQGGSGRYGLIEDLMEKWEYVNAKPAAEWWGKQSQASLRRQGILWEVPRFCPVLERLLKK